MKPLVIPALLLLTFLGQSHAQEKEFELTGSSKRGNLVNLSYDAAGKKQFTLSYLTPMTVNGKGVYETYIFDNNFKLVSQDKKEDDLTKFSSKVQTSKKYNGDSYTTESVFATYTSFSFDLVLQNKKNTYTYNWDINDYFVSSQVSGEKVIEPNPEEGAAYYYYYHAENEVAGTAMVLASVRDKMFGKGVDVNKYLKKYRIMTVDKTLNLVKNVNLDFASPKEPMAEKVLYNSADPSKIERIVLLFAPVKGIRTPKKKKDEPEPAVDENAAKYCLVQVNAAGDILSQMYFDYAVSGWKVSDFVLDEKTNDMYVYGPSKPGAKVSTNGGVSTQEYGELTFIKIVGDKIAHIKTFTTDAIKEKTYTVGGKATKAAYTGRNFETMGTLFTKSGEFLLYGVNYDVVDSAGNKSNFDELITFHFDKQGDIKSVYAIAPNKKQYYVEAPIPNKMIITEDEKIYWILEENDGIKKNLTTTGSVTTNSGSFTYSGSFAWKYKYLLYPRIIKIDVNNATMTEDAEKIGKGVFYLDNRFPYIINKNEIVFFGASTSDKKIWFKRTVLQ